MLAHPCRTVTSQIFAALGWDSCPILIQLQIGVPNTDRNCATLCQNDFGMCAPADGKWICAPNKSAAVTFCTPPVRFLVIFMLITLDFLGLP